MAELRLIEISPLARSMPCPVPALTVCIITAKIVQKVNKNIKPPDTIAAGEGLRLAQLTAVTGLSPELIRAWERRYGFPTPDRTGGGHRRYSQHQVDGLHRAVMLIRSGFRARDAIARATQEIPDEPAAGAVQESAQGLAEQLVGGDAGQALAVLLQLERTLGFEVALERTVLPAMHLIGDQWADGTADVAQEHTATGLVLSWLGTVRAGLARRAPGPREILVATPPGEHHAVPVWALEILLTRRGIAALALGSDVPQASIVRELTTRQPKALVLAIQAPGPSARLEAAASAAAEAGVALFMGGPGATRLPPGVRSLPAGLTAAADSLAEFARG